MRSSIRRTELAYFSRNFAGTCSAKRASCSSKVIYEVILHDGENVLSNTITSGHLSSLPGFLPMDIDDSEIAMEVLNGFPEHSHYIIKALAEITENAPP